MSCIKTELLRKYIDKEASHSETCLVEKHLAVCPECTARVAELQHLSCEIKKALDLLVSGEPVVPGFMVPVVPVNTKTPWRSKLILGAAAASILACLVTGVIFHMKSQPAQQIITMSFTDREVDANHTVAQQQMLIKVIDANGKVSRYPAK
jgi:anti-sigma factor RsiW